MKQSKNVLGEHQVVKLGWYGSTTQARMCVHRSFEC